MLPTTTCRSFATLAWICRGGGARWGHEHDGLAGLQDRCCFLASRRSDRAAFVADGESECPEGPCCASGSAMPSREAGCHSPGRSMQWLTGAGGGPAPTSHLRPAGVVGVGYVEIHITGSVGAGGAIPPGHPTHGEKIHAIATGRGRRRFGWAGLHRRWSTACGLTNRVVNADAGNQFIAPSSQHPSHMPLQLKRPGGAETVARQ